MRPRSEASHGQKMPGMNSAIIVTPHEAPEMVVVGEWVASID